MKKEGGTGGENNPKSLVDTLCVVNNGSVDNTARETKEAGALVIDLPINLGAGAEFEI